MKLLSAQPDQLAHQISSVLQDYDEQQLMQELFEFGRSFSPSKECFPTTPPCEEALGYSQEAPDENLADVYLWCLKLLRVLVSHPDILGMTAYQEAPTERYIAAIQRLTHTELFMVIFHKDLGVAPDHLGIDTPPDVKQIMVYFLYWLNEAAYFEENSVSEEDIISWLDELEEEEDSH